MIAFQKFHNFNASESYTHDDWVYRDVSEGFSRLYYIIDGEGYYEEDGQVTRLKKGYLYLTPIKRTYSLYENPQDKLLHTYSHVYTTPAVTRLIEVEVVPGTILANAVDLYRQYIHADTMTLARAIHFVLSCIDQPPATQTVAEKARSYLDALSDFSFDMATLSRALGYSREHITRSFLDAYRITPKQYFNQLRMNAALQKLLQGKKVSEVAAELHFSSSYAFSNAYKLHFGLSPKKHLPALKQSALK
ncbi:MAG: helix-turn-helix domain-containing protein [Oscillospiraceae bacterium]|nr:helix-turn-helix domain-containing protein [Oscillospiraceae bacterium]